MATFVCVITLGCFHFEKQLSMLFRNDEKLCQSVKETFCHTLKPFWVLNGLSIERNVEMSEVVFHTPPTAWHRHSLAHWKRVSPEKSAVFGKWWWRKPVYCVWGYRFMSEPFLLLLDTFASSFNVFLATVQSHDDQKNLES